MSFFFPQLCLAKMELSLILYKVESFQTSRSAFVQERPRALTKLVIRSSAVLMRKVELSLHLNPIITPVLIQCYQPRKGKTQQRITKAILTNVPAPLNAASKTVSSFRSVLQA